MNQLLHCLKPETQLPKMIQCWNKDNHDTVECPQRSIKKKQDKGVPTTITPHGGGADFGTMPASTITGNQSNDILPDADQTNKEAIDKMKMIFEDPAADMIVCTLDILGDPGWIEQKTVRKGSRQQSQAGPYIESDGSISTDGRAQIIEKNAKLPTDIDDNTGLYKLDNTAFFQGTLQAYIL